MRQFLIGLALSGLILSANVALAGPPSGPGGPPPGGPGGPHPGGPGGPPHGGPAPAPEIGALLVGLAIAGAFGVYMVRRREKALI